jgi:hypothetical protein
LALTASFKPFVRWRPLPSASESEPVSPRDGFGRSRSEKGTNSAVKVLDPHCLLMADVLNFAPYQGNTWSYNHGKFPGFFLDFGATPSFNGMNELFGDGRVVWKSVNQFILTNLNSANNAVGQVRAYGSDSVFY